MSSSVTSWKTRLRLVRHRALKAAGLSSPNNKPTYNNTTGYWTIPCVIKDAGGRTSIPNDSIVTLSGSPLPLTAKAQGELSNDTELNVISEGYIDGTIKISTHELSLIGKSKRRPRQKYRQAKACRAHLHRDLRWKRR